MTTTSTPRVNFELLERFVNQKVLLVGQVSRSHLLEGQVLPEMQPSATHGSSVMISSVS